MIKNLRTALIATRGWLRTGFTALIAVRETNIKGSTTVFRLCKCYAVYSTIITLILITYNDKVFKFRD
jgi:hypothetical protein